MGPSFKGNKCVQSRHKSNRGSKFRGLEPRRAIQKAHYRLSRLTTFTFTSINVGREGTTHDLALTRVHKLHMNIVLVQEKWQNKHAATKIHNDCNCHIPCGDLKTRPRAINYTRKSNKEISASQVTAPSSSKRDHSWVVISRVTFLNIYKALLDSTAF